MNIQGLDARQVKICSKPSIQPQVAVHPMATCVGRECRLSRLQSRCIAEDPRVENVASGHHRHFGAVPGMSAHAPDNGHPQCKSRRDEAIKRKQGPPSSPSISPVTISDGALRLPLPGAMVAAAYARGNLT